MPSKRTPAPAPKKVIPRKSRTKTPTPAAVSASPAAPDFDAILAQLTASMDEVASISGALQAMQAYEVPVTAAGVARLLGYVVEAIERRSLATINLVSCYGFALQAVAAEAREKSPKKFPKKRVRTERRPA